MSVRSTRVKAALGFAGLLIATASAAAAGPASAATQGGDSTYIVLYHGASSPDAAATVSSAGGTLVANYSQIGVVIARSSDPNFAATVQQNGHVAGAARTDGFATKVSDVTSTSGPVDAPTPAPGSDPLSGLQWDMNQIKAPEAHAINGGSPSVVVGDIDTGLDVTHPVLAPNVDFADSASCLSGAADTSPAAWMDDNGHGTHTAGTIAAAKNGIGIVGVAPNVKLAGIKAGNADGFFFPEAVVCAFMWAGTHHINITNNSYFADPWLFNCRNDPEQRAIWVAERRAIQFAQSQGTLVVAAAGNQADDMSHPTVDATSPDDTTPVTRDITNACAVVPVEVPGVVGVTATGNLRQKSFYSLLRCLGGRRAAPGGDSILQLTDAARERPGVVDVVTSLINTTCLPARRVFEGTVTYCYQQGTSMASRTRQGCGAVGECHRQDGWRPPVQRCNRRPTRFHAPVTRRRTTSSRLSTVALRRPCQGGVGHNSWYGFRNSTP
jgi:hypothetical protein